MLARASLCPICMTDGFADMSIRSGMVANRQSARHRPAFLAENVSQRVPPFEDTILPVPEH